LFAIVKPYRIYFYIGLILSLLLGAELPFGGVLMGKMIGILSNPYDPDFRNKSNLFSFFFLLLGIYTLII